MPKGEFKQTALEELGEFELIKRLTQGIEYFHKSTVRGVGDDACSSGLR